MNNQGKMHRPPGFPHYPFRRIGRPVEAGHRPPALLSVRSIANVISEIATHNKGKTHRPPRFANYPFLRIGLPVGAGHRPPALFQFDLSQK